MGFTFSVPVFLSSFLKGNFFIFILCARVLCLCGTPYAYNARRGQKGASGPLTLEIQRAVNHHVGSQNQIEAGSVREQSVLSAAESPKPQHHYFSAMDQLPRLPELFCFLTPSPTHLVIFLLDLFGMEGSNRVAGASHKNPRAGREDLLRLLGESFPASAELRRPPLSVRAEPDWHRAESISLLP